MLEWVKYPEDTDATKTSYSYDSMYRMTGAAATTNTGTALTVGYTYSDDMLTAIQTGSTTYTFSYGDFALRSSTKIGSRTLASYSYSTDGNHYLTSLDYGNGDSVDYSYDKYGNVTKETYEDSETVSYAYDNNGDLATVTDSATGRKNTYYYDTTGRLMKYTEKGSGHSLSVGYRYDEVNNLTGIVEKISGVERTTTYTYDEDNRVTGSTTGNAGRTYSYDGFGRVSQTTTKAGSSEIKKDTYSYTAQSSTKTSGQISQHVVDAAGYDKTYNYTYDDNGNIVSISDGSSSITYEYDSANQLIRENNEASTFSFTWEYDDAGNITDWGWYNYTEGELGTPIDTISYSYGDSGWGDLLTEYDGNNYSYDTIGNLTSDGSKNYTWKNGRELETITQRNGTVWTNTYDANGMRIRRASSAKVYDYVYNGSQLSQMWITHVSSETIDKFSFTYDANGIPMTITYNGTTYYYVTNIQGDVVAILNSSGQEVVSYTYDAWGYLWFFDGSMAFTLGQWNPLRYRGYVYDHETGLYYLESRYYNPKIGRFLNADVFASTGQGFVGNNMFAYCLNNPIINLDESGMWTVGISLSLSAVLGLGVSISVSWVMDDNGNSDLQFSYAIPWVADTMMIGAVAGGGGIALQYTEADTVYDLLGPSSAIGANGGAGVAVGGDIISFSKVADPDSVVNGYQLFVGAGVGLDVHVVESNTISVIKKSKKEINGKETLLANNIKKSRISGIARTSRYAG